MKQFQIRHYQKIQEWTKSKIYQWICFFSLLNFILSIAFNWEKFNLLRFVSYIWLPLLLFYLLCKAFTWGVKDLQDK